MVVELCPFLIVSFLRPLFNFSLFVFGHEIALKQVHRKCFDALLIFGSVLDEDLNIKISDFGFATYIDHDEQYQELMGTPGYMAPEMLKCAMRASSFSYYFFTLLTYKIKKKN